MINDFWKGFEKFFRKHAFAFDIIDLSNKLELVLMQITTARQPDSSKIDMLVNQLDDLDHQQLKRINTKKIQGWVVSLYEFTSEIPTHKNLLVTAGDSLIPILGEDLFARLREIKESFSN